MREIKFRAWGGLPNRMIDNVSTGTIHIFGDKGEQIHSSGCIFMQFTGILDKNGKEIYEGDILDFENSYVTEICWKNNGFRLNDDSIRSDLSHGLVIGNIHENPELLGR